MPDELKSWAELTYDEMRKYGDLDIVSNTLTEEEFHTKFYAGYGDVKGKPFTLWTKSRVYFPRCFDGSEWVESVSRNPDGQPTKHIGNG